MMKHGRRMILWLALILMAFASLGAQGKNDMDGGYKAVENPFCVFVYRANGEGYAILKKKALVYCFLAPWKELEKYHYRIAYRGCSANTLLTHVNMDDYAISLNVVPTLAMPGVKGHQKVSWVQYSYRLVCTDKGMAAIVSLEPMQNKFEVKARSFHYALRQLNPAEIPEVQKKLELQLLGKDLPEHQK